MSDPSEHPHRGLTGFIRWVALAVAGLLSWAWATATGFVAFALASVRGVGAVARAIARGFIAWAVAALRGLGDWSHHVFVGSASWFRVAFGPNLGLVQHRPRPARAPRTLVTDDGALPAVRIVTPCLNGLPFVTRTVSSVLAQDHPAITYIVQDGGSDDGTIEALAEIAPPGVVIAEHDLGQADALRRGFRGTSEPIMAYLNADDIYLPGAVRYAAAYFRDHPDVDVIYSHRLILDEEGRELGRWILPRHDDETLSWADYVPQETMFWRRTLWEAAGGSMDTSFDFAMDWDLLLRFRDAGAKMVRLPTYLAAFRLHTGQKSQRLMDDVGRPEMDRLRFREHGYVPTPKQVRRALIWFGIRQTIYDRAGRSRRPFEAKLDRWPPVPVERSDRGHLVDG